MKSTQQYAVTVTYSFDADVVVYLFDDEDTAKGFLYSNYKEELRIDMEENGFNVESNISDDGWYAEIICYFNDHDDTTKFRIGRVYA